MGDKGSTRIAPTKVSLCLPQIPHGHVWDRKRDSAVAGRRLITTATAQHTYTNNNTFYV
jgi:hypothetical protein